MRRGRSIAACLATFLLPATLYAQAAAEKIPDLSGDWFHPVIERFRRVDDKTLSYQITIDDPGAYTKTWTSGPRNFARSESGFLRYQWACSTRDTLEHYEKVGSAGNPGS